SDMTGMTEALASRWACSAQEAQDQTRKAELAAAAAAEANVILAARNAESDAVVKYLEGSLKEVRAMLAWKELVNEELRAKLACAAGKTGAEDEKLREKTNAAEQMHEDLRASVSEKDAAVQALDLERARTAALASKLDTALQRVSGMEQLEGAMVESQRQLQAMITARNMADAADAAEESRRRVEEQLSLIKMEGKALEKGWGQQQVALEAVANNLASVEAAFTSTRSMALGKSDILSASS
ncbi:hypothetical protein CYMTET_53275, partial [Cymbomonas tetramitiformis]